MNVFYSNIDNPVSISVPGVAMSQITARMEGGQLLRTANGWNAIPATVGVPCVISVTATISGRTINFGSKSFRTKPLPPPVAFIEYKDAGLAVRYKGDGGKKIKKQSLLDSNGVRAALDDPDLDNIPFTVLSFEINFTDPMGNTIVDRSEGNRFTERQLAQMRQLPSGRQIFITRTRAVGPDKRTQELPPIQVIIQ
jgi:gliding motility-associated protein GldM